MRTRISGRRNDQKTPWKRTNYTISSHITNNIEAEPTSEIKRREKRSRDWERRENWEWATKNKVESVAIWSKNTEKPAEFIKGLNGKPLDLQGKTFEKEPDLKGNLNWGNEKEVKYKEMEVDEGIGVKLKADRTLMENIDLEENKELLIEGLQKRLAAEGDDTWKKCKTHYFRSDHLNGFISDLEKDLGIGKDILREQKVKDFINKEIHRYIPYDYGIED